MNRHPADRSPGRRWLLIAALAYSILGCSSDAVAPGLPSTVAPPQASSLEELADALEASVEKLSEAPALEVTEEDYLDGERSRSIWAKSWPNGDWVSVENTDLSVAEGESSEVVTTRARIQIGDMFYTAGTGTDGAGSPWLAVETGTSPQEGGHFLPISVPLQVMEEGFFLFDLEDVPADTVTVQRSDTTANGVLWSLEVSWPDEATTIQHWEVAESGHLATFSMRVDRLPISEGMTPSPEPPTVTVDASRQWEVVIEFAPLEDPGQLTAPPIGEALDLQVLGVPDDLPLTD